jgi:class 3 adenylate cyclase
MVSFCERAEGSGLSSELDSEELHRLICAFFETVDGVIAGHGGSIDRHIGDCVMAVFGAPVAHGNDAERAVRAASAIQEAMARIGARFDRHLQTHIGLASGEVIAAGTGSQAFREYTVTDVGLTVSTNGTPATSDTGTRVFKGS